MEKGIYTNVVKEACTGKYTCDYKIEHTIIGDPSPGCEKIFVTKYLCNGKGDF